jgi:hypothetical protein
MYAEYKPLRNLMRIRRICAALSRDTRLPFAALRGLEQLKKRQRAMLMKSGGQARGR